MLICYFRFLHLYRTHLHHELTWRHSTPRSAGWTRVCSNNIIVRRAKTRLDVSVCVCVSGFFCRHRLGSSGAEGRWLWEWHSGHLQLRQWNPLPKRQNQSVPLWDGRAHDCLVSRAQRKMGGNQPGLRNPARYDIKSKLEKGVLNIASKGC